MRSIRRRRTAAAAFAIVAMLCNVAAGLICMGLAAQGALGAPADPFAQVICSEHGLKAVSPAEEQSPEKGKHDLCQLCLAAASLAVAPPTPAQSSIISHALAAWDTPAPATTFAQALRRNGFESRGPPLPV